MEVAKIILLSALVVHLLLIGACAIKVWRGRNAIERLIAADLVGVLGLSVLILLAMVLKEPLLVDAALGLAAMGFIGTILLAKLIAEQHARPGAARD